MGGGPPRATRFFHLKGGNLFDVVGERTTNSGPPCVAKALATRLAVSKQISFDINLYTHTQTHTHTHTHSIVQLL